MTIDHTCADVHWSCSEPGNGHVHGRAVVPAAIANGDARVVIPDAVPLRCWCGKDVTVRVDVGDRSAKAVASQVQPGHWTECQS